MARVCPLNLPFAQTPPPHQQINNRSLTLRTQQTLYIGFILRRYLYTKHERTSLCGRSLTDKNVSSAGHEQHDGLVGGKKQVPAKKRPLDSAIGPNNNALSFKIPIIPRLAQNRCEVSDLRF